MIYCFSLSCIQIFSENPCFADGKSKLFKWNLAYTELLAARLAYEAAEKKDLQELLYLEELLEASRIPMEQREAAARMSG